MEDEIQSLRPALNALDLDPEELRPPRAIDPEIVERYRTTVNTYLERKALESFLNILVNDPEFENLPEADPEAFEETRRVKDRLLSTVKMIEDEGIVNLKSNLAMARSKREVLESIMLEVQTRNGLPNMMTQHDFGDNEIDIVEIDRRTDELDAKKEQLQRRKEQLMHQILVREGENDNIVKEKALIRKKIEALRDKLPMVDVDAILTSPSKLAEFEKENESLIAENEKLKATQEHFESLTAFVESLTGVRVLEVAQLHHSDDGKGIHLAKFLLLGKYEVEMKTEIAVDGQMEILTASFIPERPQITSAADEHGNCIQFTACPLHWAVESVKAVPWKTTVERLTYFFMEAVNVLEALEKRADEFLKLREHSDLLTKIPSVQEDGDQEIVCSLTHLQLSFSLHLTRDCPLSSRSVFVKDFAGFGGWKTDVIDRLKCFLQSKEFASPLDLVKDLKAEVTRMEEEEGLQIPQTPRFSLQRRHDWD